MAYNRLNTLMQYKNVVKIVGKHYKNGITTYAWIYREHVNPIYPMSYDKFMDIVNFPNLDGEIAKERKKLNRVQTDTE